MMNFPGGLNSSLYQGNVNQSAVLTNPMSYKVKGKCVSDVKDQKSLVLHGGETFSFDFVGAEDVQ
jgi:hypothetical protein